MDDYTWIGVLAAALVVIVTVIFMFLRRRTRPNTVLLVGLTDSGKTLIFSKLVSGRSVTTYTSMKENECPLPVGKSGDRVRLVDVPGADRLRQRLQTHWLGREAATVRALVCVVDSATFTKRAKDVAEFLYDALFDCPRRVSVLVACNKQDQVAVAKSAQAISAALEREFGLINESRNAALASTDGSERKRTLTSSGKRFVWADLKRTVDFVECAAVDDGADYDLSPVEEWLAAL